jgi:hypothetical protein
MTPQSVSPHSKITTLFFSAEDTHSRCPSDLLKKIFHLLTAVEDFKSLAGASTYLNSICMSIPIKTVTSSSVRAYLYNQAISHHPKIKDALEKIIQLYHERKKAEKELMLALEDYGKELHLDPNSSDVMLFYNAASKGVNTLFKSPEISIQPEMKAISDSIIESCNSAMITTYVNQPAESITMESYRCKTRELLQVFPKNSVLAIEATLRQALKAKHKEAFLRLSDEYLNPTAKTTILPLIQEQLQIEIETMKADVEKEIADLVGSIHEATLQLMGAEQQVQTAESDYKNTCGPKRKISWGNSFSEKLAFHDHCPPEDAAAPAHARLILLLQQGVQAQKQKSALETKLKKLVVCDKNGNVIKSKLISLQASLEPSCLEDAAIKKLKKMGLFYFELAQTINEKNQYQRYKILHGKNILGPIRKGNEQT